MNDLIKNLIKLIVRLEYYSYIKENLEILFKIEKKEHKLYENKEYPSYENKLKSVLKEYRDIIDEYNSLINNYNNNNKPFTPKYFNIQSGGITYKSIENISSDQVYKEKEYIAPKTCGEIYNYLNAKLNS
jgi:hypothetical protein